MGTKFLLFLFGPEIFIDLLIAIDCYTIDLLSLAIDFTTSLLFETSTVLASNLDLTNTVLELDAHLYNQHHCDHQTTYH